MKDLRARIEKFIILSKITAVMLGMVLLLGHTDKSQNQTMVKEKIFVSFDTENQNFEKDVLPALTKIAIKHPTAVLVHSYATRDYCEKFGCSTIVLDKLENLFGDRQINIVNEKGFATTAEKEKMAKMSIDEMSKVYLIGPMEDSEDKKLFDKAGSEVIQVSSTTSL